METPHLDKTIEQLKGLAERVPTKEVKEKLQEYEAIKKALSIHSVSNCTDTKVFEAARAVVDCEGSYYSRCKEAIHYLDELVRIMSEIEDANDTV